MCHTAHKHRIGRSNQRACRSSAFPPAPHSLGREIAIKLFRFLTVLQSPFLELPTVGIHKCNLLKARVVICSYNDHVRLLSPSPLVGFSTTKVYSGIGADIVMESITRFENWRDGSLSVMPRSDCLTEPYGIVSRWKLPGDVS